MRIALVSDSHLSLRARECVLNWQAAWRAVDAMAPSLTVHLGDITRDGQGHPQELEFAARLFEEWPTPMRCVPGNHDIGIGSGEEPLDPLRLGRFRERFGEGRWRLRYGPWWLIGLDAQRLGSGGAEEADQWRWLEHDVAGSIRPGQHSIVFLHRPLVRAEADRQHTSGRYVQGAAAERLLQGPLRASLRAVLSGHTHQSLDFVQNGVHHVWVPSSAYVMDDTVQASVGRKIVGIGLLTLGAHAVHYAALQPQGMQTLELSQLGSSRRPDDVSATRQGCLTFPTT